MTKTFLNILTIMSLLIFIFMLASDIKENFSGQKPHQEKRHEIGWFRGKMPIVKEAEKCPFCGAEIKKSHDQTRVNK